MSQRKSGRMRSTPYMLGSGNISPASTTTMRPSCSIAAQFRPISPRPPRKVTRTESLATRCLEARPRPGRLGVERRRHSRRAAGGTGRRRIPRRTQRGLGRHRVGVQSRCSRRRNSAPRRSLNARALVPVAAFDARARAPRTPGRPVRRDRHDADGADRHEGQQHGVVAAVEVELVAEHGLGSARPDAGRPRRPSWRRCSRARARGRSWSTTRSCARCATGMS